MTDYSIGKDLYGVLVRLGFMILVYGGCKGRGSVWKSYIWHWGELLVYLAGYVDSFMLPDVKYIQWARFIILSIAILRRSICICILTRFLYHVIRNETGLRNLDKENWHLIHSAWSAIRSWTCLLSLLGAWTARNQLLAFHSSCLSPEMGRYPFHGKYGTNQRAGVQEKCVCAEKKSQLVARWTEPQAKVHISIAPTGHIQPKYPQSHTLQPMTYSPNP